VRRFAGFVATLALAGALVTSASGAQGPTLRIVFPEGMSVRQMTDRVAAVRRIAISQRKITPLLDGRSYAAAARAAAPPAGFAPKPRAIEGFLFPALYKFGPSTRAKELIALQLAAFRREWAKVGLAGARARGRTPYDVLTIGSMIERETVAPEERRLVAAVIYNRLEQRMPLAIDATIRYGLGIQGTRPLTKEQLATDSPYNTRLRKGLPPTPIGNPGLPSMRAAAAPAQVDYLYYVRKPDGMHHFFTADEEEFCRKAREYGYGC
jgi:uncharacterized YceG family protein